MSFLSPSRRGLDWHHPGPRPGYRRPPHPLWTQACRWGAAALLALLLAGAWPGQAHAQSLQVLYGVAKGYDASYLAARLQADAARARAEQAMALRRPTVSATGGATLSRSDTPWSSITRNNSFQQSAGITAQYTLFNRSNDLVIDQAERAVQIAHSQLRQAEQELMLRVTQAYFDVLAAADALGTVQASKRAIGEQLAAAQRNFEVGTVTITDAREAEARFDLARAQELGADNDLRTARLALDSLVGRRGMAPQPLAQPVVLPALAPANVDTWVQLAEDNSPALQQLQLNRALGQLEADKARAARLPTVLLNASVNLAHARSDGQSAASDGSTVPFGPNQGAGPSASVGVQLNMPLYTGGALEGRVKETVLLAEKADAELDAARRAVGQATRSAFYQVETQTARVGALQAAEASSTLALEATEMGYKVGLRVNLDVLNAQTQLYQARRDLAKARYDVVVNLMKLRQTAGVLMALDVSATSRLLASVAPGADAPPRP